MIRIEVNNLSPKALEWAVTMTLGHAPLKPDRWQIDAPDPTVAHARSYVSSHGVRVMPIDANSKWWARSKCGHSVQGPSFDVAVLRCMVAVNMGTVIEVPPDLI